MLWRGHEGSIIDCRFGVVGGGVGGYRLLDGGGLLGGGELEGGDEPCLGGAMFASSGGIKRLDRLLVAVWTAIRL